MGDLYNIESILQFALLLGSIVSGLFICFHQVQSLRNNLHKLTPQPHIETEQEALATDVQQTYQDWKTAHALREHNRMELKADMNELSKAREEVNVIVKDLKKFMLQSSNLQAGSRLE